MKTIFLIGLGGFVGSVLRYGISSWYLSRGIGGFPWATLAINVIGSFLLGLLICLEWPRSYLSPAVFLALSVGVLGSFTTFSTFSVELMRLFEMRDYSWALFYIVASVAGGGGAVLLAFKFFAQRSMN